MDSSTPKGTHQSIFHRNFIYLKAHYFLFFSAFGMLYPILNITLRSRGLSTTELSYISIIIPFLVFFTNPIMGFIADHLRKHQLTFNIVLLIVTISYATIFILPSIRSRNIEAKMFYDNKLGRVLDFCASQEVATKCASRSQCGCSYQASCNSTNSGYTHQFNFTFTMITPDIQKDINEKQSCGINYRIPIDRSITQYSRNSSLSFLFTRTSSQIATCEITCSIAHFCHGTRFPYQTHYIIFYALLFIIGTNFLTNAVALGVSLGFVTIDRPDIFGQQRVWGTIGFGISAFSASRIYQIFRTEYIYIFMFVITTILCIIITSFIRTQSKQIEEKEMDDISIKKKKKKSPAGLADFGPLFKKLDVIVFLTLALIWGISYAVLDPYIYLYIDEVAPCQSHSVVGFMSAASATAEVIAFFFAGKVLKFLGTSLASVMILLAFAIRYSGYYFIRNPYFLTLMEPMHFFNFGILYVLIAQETDAIAPAGLSSTLQSLALGVMFGLGRGVGLVVSSFIYTLIDQRLLFLIFSIFNLICAVIFAIYFIIKRQRTKKRAENNTVPSKVVIDSDAVLNDEPLLIPRTENKTDY